MKINTKRNYCNRCGTQTDIEFLTLVGDWPDVKWVCDHCLEEDEENIYQEDDNESSL